jgi:hypothetical protein
VRASRAVVVISLVLGVATAGAQPSLADPSSALREANTAAAEGDWERVRAVVESLLATSLDRADLAEAHRLAGIAAILGQPSRRDLAERHFLEYLRLDLDGHLDPALYPPEVTQFFADVRARHASELRARRPKARRYAVLALLPPFGQFQNGDRTTGIVIGSLLGTFVVANVASYLVLRSWCSEADLTCDATKDRTSSAETLRRVNITAGVGLIITYVYGVYDGVRGYRRSRRESILAPYATATNESATFGVRMNF